MARYVDVEELSAKMYHEAFETDSDMQRWDGGCWIRYKLFEKCRNATQTADVVPVVRCLDCKHSESWYRDKRRCFLWNETGIDVFEDGYCSYGERKKI